MMAYLLAGLSIGSAWADQLVLKNGDRISGTVNKQDGKSISMKSYFRCCNHGVGQGWNPFASTLPSPCSCTAESRSRAPLQLAATSKSRTKTLPEPAAPADVTAIRDATEHRAYERLLKPGWGELWTGAATVRLAGTAGNPKTITFTTGVNAARVTQTEKTSIYISIMKGTATVNGRSADPQAVCGGVAYDHNISPRFFITTLQHSARY